MKIKTIDQIKSQIEALFKDLHCEKIQAFQLVGKNENIIFTVGYYFTEAGKQIRYNRGSDHTAIYYSPENINSDPKEKKKFNKIENDFGRLLELFDRKASEIINLLHFQKGFLVLETDKFMESEVTFKKVE